MHFKKQSASGMCIKKPPAAKRTVTFRNAVRRSVGPSDVAFFVSDGNHTSPAGAVDLSK
jgi:hypothetical protein